jgi:hypothetical protein
MLVFDYKLLIQLYNNLIFVLLNYKLLNKLMELLL